MLSFEYAVFSGSLYTSMLVILYSDSLNSDFIDAYNRYPDQFRKVSITQYGNDRVEFNE